MPELYCSDFAESLRFYEAVGFEVRYSRADERFAYLALGAAELMIEEPVDESRTLLAGLLEYPYGRGVNLQIPVDDALETYNRARSTGATIHWEIEERWYRQGHEEVGIRQFVVADPDGYLLRFAQALGTRPATGLLDGL